MGGSTGKNPEVASQFTELTTWDDRLKTLYPSISRLYQGPNFLVAIPTSYGIMFGSSGFAVRLDAEADDSATSVSGCHFHLTFTVGPIIGGPACLPVGAGDMVWYEFDKLKRDVYNEFQKDLVLPTELDSRVVPRLTSPVPIDFTATTSASPPRGAFELAVDIADDGQVPSTTHARVFLAALCGPLNTAPLFGELDLRLDDVHIPTVESPLVLNFNHACVVDDISIYPDPKDQSPNLPFKYSATNVQTRFNVNVFRALSRTPDGLDRPPVEKFGEALPPFQSMVLESVDSTIRDYQYFTYYVERSPTLPDPLSLKSLSGLIDVHVEAVQHSNYPLTLNAAGFDFAADGVLRLDVQIALDGLPTLNVPKFSLIPEHRIESVSILIPVDAVINGLGAHVDVSVVEVDPSRTRNVEVSHDFMVDPILVLTSNVLA